MSDETEPILDTEDFSHLGRRIVGAALGRPVYEIAMTDGLHTLPEWDSLAQAEIVVAIESSTGLSVDDESTFEALTTVVGIQRFLEEHCHDV